MTTVTVIVVVDPCGAIKWLNPDNCAVVVIPDALIWLNTDVPVVLIPAISPLPPPPLASAPTNFPVDD